MIPGSGGGGRSRFDWGLGAIIGWVLFIWSWYLKGTHWMAEQLYWIASVFRS